MIEIRYTATMVATGETIHDETYFGEASDERPLRGLKRTIHTLTGDLELAFVFDPPLVPVAQELEP